MLPGGARGVTIRALHRAELGRAEAAGGALRIERHRAPRRRRGERARPGARTRVPRRRSRRSSRRAAPAASPRSCARSSTPAHLADTAGYSPDLSFERKLELLETLDVDERLSKAIAWARDALGEIELRRRIRDDVDRGHGESSQREFLLRRQIDAIRKELGERATTTTRSRATASGSPRSPLSDEARKEAERELGRLAARAAGPEASTIRTYLDWLLSLPWGELSDERLDVNAARAVLEADHAGLEEVKERILEYLAVRKFRREREIEDERSGAILAWSGRPASARPRSASRSPARSDASSCA